ncbi:hypothetical protein SK128_015598 [Halocaridina rubra]|uniref:Uncharacterized protein n=1 Tax=Halocaridina rubra TaxID=373956 RepID=A0AAN8WL32_HALRR
MTRILRLHFAVQKTAVVPITAPASHIVPGASSCIFRKLSTRAKRDEGEWIHALDYTQKVFLYGQRAGTRFNVPTYTLHARKPLSHDTIYKATQNIIRRSWVYQVVVREKEGELWWNKQDDVEVDIKIHQKGASKVDVLNKIWSEGFDEVNGPLWKTRLLESDEEDKFVSTEIKKEYPHRYYFYSFPHHALVDGQSAALFSQPIIDSINAVIEGEDIDDSKPIGEFVSNEEYLKADIILKEKLSKDPQRLETIKEIVNRSTKAPEICKYIPRPVVNKPMTKHTFVEVEPQILKKFLENCKAKGLTYGNSLQTVTNTAIVEMIQEAGACEEFYDMSVNMTIDTRRYLKKRALPALGLHARQMASLFTMPKNPRDRFWENCQNIHQSNKELLKSGSAIEQDVIRQYFIPQVPAEEFFQNQPALTRDYGFNNVGSLDPVIHGRGKHVQITHIESYQAVHNYTFPFYQQLFTYRGNDINMISYSTDCLTDDTVQQLLDRIRSIITQYANKS